MYNTQARLEQGIQFTVILRDTKKYLTKNNKCCIINKLETNELHHNFSKSIKNLKRVLTKTKKWCIINKFAFELTTSQKVFLTLKKVLDKNRETMYNKKVRVERNTSKANFEKLWKKCLTKIEKWCIINKLSTESKKNLEKITAQQVRKEAETNKKEFEKSNTHKDYMRVWSWLRTNAGGVLNKCKSNEELCFGTIPSGGLVSNTWVTNLIQGDN